MPEAKADALGGDARMAALAANTVTFQHTTSSSAMALLSAQANLQTSNDCRRRRDNAGATC